MDLAFGTIVTVGILGTTLCVFFGLQVYARRAREREAHEREHRQHTRAIAAIEASLAELVAALRERLGRHFMDPRMASEGVVRLEGAGFAFVKTDSYAMRLMCPEGEGEFEINAGGWVKVPVASLDAALNGVCSCSLV